MKLLAHYLNTLQQTRPEIINWRENDINDSLFYSYRSTCYDRQTYPSSLHYHDYYELVVIVEGDIRYICESAACQPQPGDVVLIPPRRLHMSQINADATRYQRHVFYLYSDALDALGCGALTGFLARGEEARLLAPSQRGRQELLSLLPRLDHALRQDALPEDRALALGLVIEIFYWLSEARPREEAPTGAHLPENVLAIQRYLDEHFADIATVSEVAARFFYSREYVSRLFRRHFHTTVADYIMQRRVAQSQALIGQGEALSDVCYQVGFGSMATFIRAFRALTNMTPSQYRAMVREDT